MLTVNKLFATKAAGQAALVVLIAMSCGLFFRPSIAAELRPDEAIEKAVAMLSMAIEPRHEELTHDRQEMYGVVDDFLLRYADMRGACRVIMSKHWKNATSEQRTRFINAFNSHVSNLLVDLFLEMKFDTLSVQPCEGDLEEIPVMVKTTVRLDNGSVASFNFRMHDNDGDWRILDVVAGGVSYVKLYRSQITVEVAEYGLDQVIERFEQKSARETATQLSVPAGSEPVSNF